MIGVDSLISSLPTFSGTAFFLGDEMHLIAKGISTLVFNLLDPVKNSKFMKIGSTKTYTFTLKNSSVNSMDIILKKIYNTRVDIPSAFEGSWDSAVGFYRAVDYLDFLLYAVPTIVLPLVVDLGARNALMNLVNGCSISLQWNISESDISKMKK